MRLEYQILVAVAVDLIVGDPRWFPHPVKWMGRLALWLETLTRSAFRNEAFAGIFTGVCTVGICAGVSALLIWGAGALNTHAAELVCVAILYTTIAIKDLVRHSTAVYLALNGGNINVARIKTGMMVGRATENLNENELVRATVESVAENMVDGAISPLFYALVLGPVGAVAYKTINTLDSMFGYKDERYRRFGKFSARLDDFANFLPARIGAMTVAIGAKILGLDWRRCWNVLWRDGGQHDSPNAGWPEAAFAGALGVRLGGVNVYGGKPMVKPYLGDGLRSLELYHIKAANKLMLCTVFIFLVLGVSVRFALLG